MAEDDEDLREGGGGRQEVGVGFRIFVLKTKCMGFADCLVCHHKDNNGLKWDRGLQI